MNARYKNKYIILLLCFIFFKSVFARHYYFRRYPNWAIKFGAKWKTYEDMNVFLVSSFVKFKSTKCTTVIWDDEMALKMISISLCYPSLRGCNDRVVYVLNLNDSQANATAGIESTLKAGYNERCGNYLLLLHNTETILSLLQDGDDKRLMNTRANYLIWYAKTDKEFESNDIWRKYTNVVLFHSKLKRRFQSKRMTFTMKSIIWPIIENSMETTHIIEFWRGGEFSKMNEQWFRDKTTNLKNTTLRLLVVEHPPGVIRFDFPDGTHRYAGTELQMITELSEIMNFHIQSVETNSTTKWGGFEIKNETREFYGAVSSLIYDEADIGIGSFFILKHYLEYLDMSVPIDVACTSFLTPNPLRRPRFLAMIFPFQYQLWIVVLLVCFVLAPLALYLISQLTCPDEYRIFTVPTNLIFTSLSIMSQVALHVWPKKWPFRIIIGWYWMFCLLITLAYRGAMVAFLTIPLFERPINNLKDLEHSNLRIGGWGEELQKLFSQLNTAVGDENARVRLINRYELLQDLEEGITEVAAGRFALYENVRFLKFVRKTKHLSSTGASTMRLMKQCVVPVHIGIAYQKNSPLTFTINKYIKRFQESGLMIRWSRRVVGEARKQASLLTGKKQDKRDTNIDGDNDDEDNEEDEAAAYDTKKRKQRVFTTEDLQGAIYLVIFGFSFSTIVFLLELLMGRTQRVSQTTQMVLNVLFDRTSKIKDPVSVKKIVWPQKYPLARVIRGQRRPKKGEIMFTYLK